MAVQEKNLERFLAIGSERQKQDYMKTISGTLNGTLSLHLQSVPTDSQAARLAFTTLLRRKGRILDAVTNNLQLLQQNLTPENQELLEEWQNTNTQLANLIYKQPENLSLEQYRQQVGALKATAEKLESELARRSTEFRVETQPVEIEAVQKLIPENAALVEIIRYEPFDPKAPEEERWGEPRYAVYILKVQGEPEWVDLGEAKAIESIYLRPYLADKLSAARGSVNAVKAQARQLDELLMQPIRQKLGNKTHLLLSPDGALNLIPFEALVDENDQYLIENYTVTYLTTGRDLLKLQLDIPS